MSYETRIAQLEKLHRNLDHYIDAMERNHAGVDEIKVKEMKKQRLQYMDELSRLRRLQMDSHQTVDLDDDR